MTQMCVHSIIIATEAIGENFQKTRGLVTAQVLLKNTANISDHNMINTVAWQQEGPGFEPQAEPFPWGVCAFVFFHLCLIPHSKDKQRPGQWLYTANRHERESPVRVSPRMDRCGCLPPNVNCDWLTQVSTDSSVTNRHPDSVMCFWPFSAQNTATFEPNISLV